MAARAEALVQLRAAVTRELLTLRLQRGRRADGQSDDAELQTGIVHGQVASARQKIGGPFARGPPQGVDGNLVSAPDDRNSTLVPRCATSVLTRIARTREDRKSTRLNSSHSQISYA